MIAVHVCTYLPVGNHVHNVVFMQPNAWSSHAQVADAPRPHKRQCTERQATGRWLGFPGQKLPLCIEVREIKGKKRVGFIAGVSVRGQYYIRFHNGDKGYFSWRSLAVVGSAFHPRVVGPWTGKLNFKEGDLLWWQYNKGMSQHTHTHTHTHNLI
jgi:hypothetical protein